MGLLGANIVFALVPVAAPATAFATALATDHQLPQLAPDKHLGVSTCDSSACHGGAFPSETENVGMNEFRIWAKDDPHSKAYAILSNPLSKRIARNLGLKSARTAKECLDCHADNAESVDTKTFQISEGVGCEACHGGAERWLNSHKLPGATHAENIANGMYPTDEGPARAKLCLSCHLGTKDKLANHRLMGAGHPRLAFELEAYLSAGRLPLHYTVDADYAERKPNAVSGFDLWLVGQVTQARQTVDLIEHYVVNQNSWVPELFFFDCHACHHGMTDTRWKPTQAGAGLPPGVLRINDAHFVMLWALLEVVAPDQAPGFLKRIQGLHQASLSGPDKIKQALAKLRQSMSAAGDVLQQSLTEAQMKHLRKVLITKAAAGEFRDYILAEQAFFAVENLSFALNDVQRIGKPLIKLRNTLDDPKVKENRQGDDFNPKSFQRAARALKQAIK